MKRLCLFALLIAGIASAEDLPKVLDDRLKLELIAEAPVVRTPTGITIDEKGRVYVIESHTHFRPNGYDGPKADRILRFEKRKDGSYEPSVFFEGTTHTMGCGFHPDGSLYVATRMEIFKLIDKNDNGRIDDGERTNLVKHDTPGNYPHNGLSGFAFDFAGNVYFGQGENLGAAYKLIGSDGKTLSGGGEGGNIYCMKADGSELRRVATGFWNPFHLYMDPFGRLFAVDNDPDSRPPCRLIHVVEGGDYGYRFRNGRKGTHPFTAWNGELPGTLPMVSGTGEAPSGIVGFGHADRTPLEHAVVVTSWGDHRLETHFLEPRGSSWTSISHATVAGGESFRPVGLAWGLDQSLFFTDWVDKSYQLHGKGRLWRLSYPKRHEHYPDRWIAPKPARRIGDYVPKAKPEEIKRIVEEQLVSGESSGLSFLTLDRLGIDSREYRKIVIGGDFRSDIRARALGGSLGAPPALPDDFDVLPFAKSDQPADIRYAATRRLDPTKHLDRLLELVGDPDPFIQQAARYALKPAAEELAGFAFDKETRPATRLGVALVLREANTEAGQKRIPELLSDSDPRVRFVAIQWIGEERLKDVWSQVRADLESRLSTRQELEAFLATSAFLSDEKYDPGKEAPGEEFVVKMLFDKNTKPERQAFLLRMLRADHPALTDERLKQWFDGDDAGLRLAALQVISQRGAPPKFLSISELAQDAKRPMEERLEAISLLSPANPNYMPLLLNLTKNEHKWIAEQAARSIRVDEKVAASNALAISRESRPSVEDLSAWNELLAERVGQRSSDSRSGALVFHHQIAQCNRCHEVEGRGGEIGPNLTGIGRTMSRERLIQSILQPSKEIAPQFAVWQLETHDGRILKGMYVGEEVDGTVIYANEQGQTFKLHPRDVSERTQQPISIMPVGLAYRLTDQELRDLLAYLGSNTGK